MAITIDLPWPPGALNPNGRGHWGKKARAAKSYREAAYLATIDAMNRAKERGGWRAAHASVRFCVPETRRRDEDNHLAMLKPAWDGMVDAGLLVDDDHLRVTLTAFVPGMTRFVVVQVDREDKLPDGRTA